MDGCPASNSKRRRRILGGLLRQDKDLYSKIPQYIAFVCRLRTPSLIQGLGTVPRRYLMKKMNSTRRFWARPAAVSLDATGRALPNPAATTSSGGNPAW